MNDRTHSPFVFQRRLFQTRKRSRVYTKRRSAIMVHLLIKKILLNGVLVCAAATGIFPFECKSAQSEQIGDVND